MSALANLEPKSVFHYFEEISQIPRGSGNIKRISDYLVNFGREHYLEYYQDPVGNVILIKEATPGMVDHEPVILQGHMDMVAVKTQACPLDMKKDGLVLRVKDDEISAAGTSLGGDDGIAIAYALALLDSNDIPHPRLEVVLTVDEEVGMDGAREIVLSMLKGKRMINIDSEEEGVFTVGCAGGARVDFEMMGKAETYKNHMLLELKIGGLQGGHSGTEIHKERANSNQLFGRVLEELTRVYPVKLVGVKGGEADNAIARETTAKFVFAEEKNDQGEQISYRRDGIHNLLNKIHEELREEIGSKDHAFKMTWTFTDLKDKDAEAITAVDTRKIALFLCSLPNGVQAMSADIEGLVETSLNFGVLKQKTVLHDGYVLASFSVRSSVESAKNALIHKLFAIGKMAGVKYRVRSEYPGWKYRVDSPLREQMVALYQELYQADPQIVAIHAGLECGLFMSKIPDLDCVSIGPNMRNIHTTEETLSISSVQRVWEYLVMLLQRI
ncbi:MAG: aminoacyl-histidine dipeptidase [Lachnospiraceae bacterium]|nr:aminoacyl-histidine dipeptidase [Lachnospiraceae bacterium]